MVKYLVTAAVLSVRCNWVFAQPTSTSPWTSSWTSSSSWTSTTTTTGTTTTRVEHDLSNCAPIQPSAGGALGLPATYLGDGECDYFLGLNTAACGWDGGDCCQTSCESEAGAACVLDSSDEVEPLIWCADPSSVDYYPQDDLTCEQLTRKLTERDHQLLSDSNCHDWLYPFNTALCGWDGGDCCSSTCVDGDGDEECEMNGYFCHDPNATDYGFESVSCVNFNVDSRIGDGNCDDEDSSQLRPQWNGLGNLNTEVCDYDGGDCTISTAHRPVMGLWASAFVVAMPLLVFPGDA